ncbi:MAG: hypothetical protein DLM73_10870 [Chthoniobacterales bacterium]|nr:MAG: hypothetical protein DLM73_10870 [Chthoniobacterales bacterium]PZR73620.1 MAG: hypothetical protein DLM52_10625 [Chthoniobacterales bacterium]
MKNWQRARLVCAEPDTPELMDRSKQAIIREIRRLHARREPLNISALKRNHPPLIRRAYEVRPFWGWKRALEDAGLSYSDIHAELRDYVDCKICGKDLGGLGYHLISQHQITPEEYCEEYPGAELVSETIRAGISRRKLRTPPSVPQWEEVWSPEYVLDRMAELGRRKFPLNFDWAKEHEAALTDKAIRYFGSWDAALRHIGLDPARIRLFRPTWIGYSGWRRANKAAIVAELRRRDTERKPLSWKKILPEKHGPALLNRAKKVFGSWGAALAAAGFDPTGGAISLWGQASKDDILAEIHSRRRAREAVRFSQVWREKGGQPTARRASQLFGSWNAALRAAGIEPEAGQTHWAHASKGEILAEIRRRQSAGESLRCSHAAKEKHGRALQNRVSVVFGTWNAALRAAGVEPMKEDSPWRKADRAAILRGIRRRHDAGESLATTKVERTKWGGVLITRAKTFFGSWAGALVAAGVDLPPGLMSPWAKADKAAMLAEIRRRKRTGETLSVPALERLMWGTALLKRARVLFGSWNAAVIASSERAKRFSRRTPGSSLRRPRLRQQP